MSRLLPVVLLCAFSCGEPPVDRFDAGPEAIDAGDRDAGVDAGTTSDAGVDAGTTSDASVDAGTTDAGDPDAGLDAGLPLDAGLKPLPRGVYRSVGPVRSSTDDVPARLGASRRGVLLFVPWDLCDEACLYAAIQRNLDSAQRLGIPAALIVSDGFAVPARIKSTCQLFNYTFRGEAKTMCLAWDAAYLAAKKALIAELGRRFDAHPALAYVYFTGACSTNGNEGHCRVDQTAYTAAGYTATKLATAYREIMDAYLAAFPRTPLAFETHAIFNQASPWDALWQAVSATGRVGVAAWWCAERLSVRGHDTVPIWPIVQAAAARSFTVCQSVSSFTSSPWDFNDATLGLSYGTSTQFTAADSLRAFDDHLEWSKGLGVHAGQSAPISRFSVYEAWWEDERNAAFQAGLDQFNP